jgi:hypothetical protein
MLSGKAYRGVPADAADPDGDCPRTLCFLFLKVALLRSRQHVQTYVSFHSTKPRTIAEFFVVSFYSRLLKGTDKLVATCDSQQKYLSRVYRIPGEHFMPRGRVALNERRCRVPSRLTVGPVDEEVDEQDIRLLQDRHL